MNLYEKIQNIRVALEKSDIKMSGKNTYAGYNYFELDDFVSDLNRLMLEFKMTAIPSFTPELATLTAYDFESEQTLTISSPFASANLKGCHEVQNVGAVETYQRRYLYQAMFDITEKDGLNGTQGKDDKKEDRRSVVIDCINKKYDENTRKGKFDEVASFLKTENAKSFDDLPENIFTNFLKKL